MAGDPFKQVPYVPIRQIGLGGIVTKVDPQDVEDTESPDVRNVMYDGGISGNRSGTTLVIAIPTGETGKPLQILKPRNSAGQEFILAVYSSGNIYAFDATYTAWVLISQAITITDHITPFGSAVWNNGRQDDRFYFGNGVDDTFMFPIAMSNATSGASAGDGTLTLADSSRFPSTGTIVYVASDGSWNTQAYSANNTTTGVLTLTGTLAKAISANGTVTMEILDKSGMPKGKIFAKFQGQLVIANKKGSETLINASTAGSPEDNTISADVGGAWQETITTGKGEIVDIISFGTFLLIGQHDLWQQLSIQLNSSLDAQQIVTTPVVAGDSVGPLLACQDIQMNNTVYYPSQNAGIYALSPSTTGSNASTAIQQVSENIFPTITSPTFTFMSGKGCAFSQKIFWLCSSFATQGGANNQLVNNLVLVYDLQYKNWAFFDNWNASDLTELNEQLYFLCHDDGGLYFYDINSSQDARSGQAVSYLSYLYTKRYDWGKSANPKQNGSAMVEGYITQNTKLYVDVLYNEGGSLALSTYVIDGNNSVYVDQIPVYGIGRASLGQNPIGGYQVGTIGFFRVYLDLLYRAGAHTVQFRFYTQNVGDNWGLTGLAVNPEEVTNIPSELRISTL